MKNLDESGPIHIKRKDVNTFQNNQEKFTRGATSIPLENMKCNILKARMEEHKKGKIYHVNVITLTLPLLL